MLDRLGSYPLIRPNRGIVENRAHGEKVSDKANS